MTFLSTGSTLFNLALSDKADGGYQLGKVANLIGDSSTGKTLLALTALAEATIRPEFDDYELILDDAEAALEFDIENLFGSKLQERINWKGIDEDNPSSKTPYDFYGNITRLVREGKKFIYVLDSLDSLSSVEEQERASDIADGKAIGGSYKMEKPKALSEVLRNIVRDIKDTQSLVIIISQTRDNIGFGAMFTPKVRSGGRALKFYCSYEIWLAMKGTEKAKDRVIGSVVEAKITKNKYTGKIREAQFPIYYSYGLDDISSCIDFLIQEKVFNRPKGKQLIDAPALDLNLTLPKLIKEIEEKNLQPQLKQIVEQTWTLIEAGIALDRMAKY